MYMYVYVQASDAPSSHAYTYAWGSNDLRRDATVVPGGPQGASIRHRCLFGKLKLFFIRTVNARAVLCAGVIALAVALYDSKHYVGGLSDSFTVRRQQLAHFTNVGACVSTNLCRVVELPKHSQDIVEVHLVRVVHDLPSQPARQTRGHERTVSSSLY